MARRFRTGSAGNYRRTKSPNWERPATGGVGFDTLHQQQRTRQAAARNAQVLEQQIVAETAQIAAGRLCTLCEGLDRHFSGCPETWGQSRSEPSATGSEASCAG